MKIEMGESLLQSYLKYVKNCLISQTNWRTSSTWQIDENSYENVKCLFDKIQNHQDFADVFKKSSLEQALKQAELDVVGIDSNKIYMVEVAFHENGLQYGDKQETKDRVCKKLLRAYLIGLSFFPNFKYEIIFTSPKVNPATNNIINEYFDELNETFGTDDNVEFKYIANQDFKDKILVPTLTQSSNDADTSELFLRTTKMLEIFDLISFQKSITNLFTANENPTQIQKYPFSPSYTQKDSTQFAVNGNPTGGKCPTIFAAVKFYIDTHPNVTFDELKIAFPDSMAKPGFGKMIRTIDEVSKNEWNGNRFKKQPIKLSDGTNIVVSTQWKPDNMKSFIDGARRLEIEITPVPYQLN